MNVSERHGERLKSQRQRELDELRTKGLAKTRRTELKGFASPLTTPEQAHQFLSDMRKQRQSTGSEHKPPMTVSADGVDAWYMIQRHREKEMRKRRLEAAELLKGYRMPYQSDGTDRSGFGGSFSPRFEGAFSPNYRRGRASFGDAMSESLVDPSNTSPTGEKRRQSSMPRLQHNWGNDDATRQDPFEVHQRSKFPAERTNFLRERNEYHGDQFTIPDDRNNYEEGRALFLDEYPPDMFSPSGLFSRDPQDRRSFGSNAADYNNNAADFIDTSASQQRLRFAEEKKTDEPNQISNDSRSRQMSQDPGRFSMEEQSIASKMTAGGESAVDDVPPVPETVWRDFISPEPGAKFPPEAGRYHLYASYACPGSHRALIVRALKGLEDVVSVTIVHPTWRHTNKQDSSDKHRGWVFGNPKGKPFHNTTGRGGPFPPAYPGNDPDPILNAFAIRDLYEYAGDNSGKFTIPLLWDMKLNTIVNNESSDISYMLNSCFNDFSKDPGLDLYTEDDEDGLDKLNQVSEWLYPMMIHGVYRCGFAKTQQAYDHAIEELTEAFDMADELLQTHRYLTGDTLTDADIRLFVTLLRFDEVYAFYFRANTRLVMMTPSLMDFCREVYQMVGVAETCQMDQIKAHFYGSHAEWNKYSVIPRGLGFMRLLDMPHNRDLLQGEEAYTNRDQGEEVYAIRDQPEGEETYAEAE